MSVLLGFGAFWQAEKSRKAVKMINVSKFNVGEVLNLADVLEKYLLFIKCLDKMRSGLLDLAKIGVLGDLQGKILRGLFVKNILKKHSQNHPHLPFYSSFLQSEYPPKPDLRQSQH